MDADAQTTVELSESDLARWKLLDKHLSIPVHGKSVVTCLIISHDFAISASDDHTIGVYELETGRQKHKLTGHEGGIWSLATAGHSDNLLLSGSTDRSVRIWDLESGRCLHVFGGHTSTVRCLVVLAPVSIDVTGEDGVSRKEIWPKKPLAVTGSRDHLLKVYSIPEKEEPVFIATEEDADENDNPYYRLTLAGHDHAVRGVAAHGRTVVSGSYDCTVRIWDPVTGECKHVLAGHTQKVYSVVYDYERAQVCSGSMDSTVRIWSTVSGACLHTLTGHTSLVGLLTLSSSYLVSAAADGTVCVWDPTSGALLQTLKDRSTPAGAITCSQHDDLKVLAGSDGRLRVWDIRSGVVVKDLLEPTICVGVWQVAYDERWCVSASSSKSISRALSGDTMLYIWDLGVYDS